MKIMKISKDRFRSLSSCSSKNGVLKIYDKRIKIKWEEEILNRSKNRRRGTSSLSGQEAANKRERHRQKRANKMTKLHSVGARCKFSIIPLSLFKENYQEFLSKCVKKISINDVYES